MATAAPVVPVEGEAPHAVPQVSSLGIDVEENTANSNNQEILDDRKSHSSFKSDEFQGGVARVRAVTDTWSKKTLVLMFVLLYLVAFIDAILVSVQSALNPYMTSSFGKHGLIPVVGIVSTILSGCSRLALSKVLDIWGRIQGFLIMLLIVIIGMIMKATGKNMETYVAAHTLYWTGHIGMMYVVDVMLADMTTLRNRMIMFGINGTPTIASTFAGPAIANAFYTNTNFRWAYGAFAIIMTAFCLPSAAVMLFMERRASQKGKIVKHEDSGRTWYQSTWFYIVEFDLGGIILVTASFALILLPFSLARYAPKGWASPYIIAMEVLGWVVLSIFSAYERWYAPVQFLPWKYLREPTILGSCLLYCFMFCSVFCWNSYFNSYLQVVHRLNITTAGYVLNAMSLASAIFGPLIGALISYTGEFKWISYAGIPCTLIGTALLIPFRTPSAPVGVLAFTQALVGLGTGIFAVGGQLGVMAPVSHQEIAVVLAIWSMFGSIGASIGQAIAGAMWNNILPAELEKRLPDELKNQTKVIFGSLVKQIAFPDGSPAREAIVDAYADVQRKMVIAGACFVPMCLASIYIWRNINVRKIEEERGKQTKGNVW